MDIIFIVLVFCINCQIKESLGPFNRCSSCRFKHVSLPRGEEVPPPAPVSQPSSSHPPFSVPQGINSVNMTCTIQFTLCWFYIMENGSRSYLGVPSCTESTRLWLSWLVARSPMACRSYTLEKVQLLLSGSMSLTDQQWPIFRRKTEERLDPKNLAGERVICPKMILLMVQKSGDRQLIGGGLSHNLSCFYDHPRWLLGISSINSIHPSLSIQSLRLLLSRNLLRLVITPRTGEVTWKPHGREPTYPSFGKGKSSCFFGDDMIYRKLYIYTHVFELLAAITQILRDKKSLVRLSMRDRCH